MSSSIIRKDLPFNRRERAHEIGMQGEINVGTLLGNYFGFDKISYGSEYYSKGTDGYPDLVLKLNPPLSIEIKSTSTFTNVQRRDKKIRRNNWVAINKIQWYNECKFARGHKMKIILIVEIRLKKRGIYFWFDEEMIEEYIIKNDKAEWCHISLHDVMNKGNSLIYPDELKYLEYWNLNTPLLNDFQDVLNVV